MGLQSFEMKSFLKNLAPNKLEEQHELIGKQISIGPYRVKVEAKLADGGYASIFRVREVEKGTVFALKQQRVQGNPEALEAVKIEARIMHQLRGHPNILKLLAVAISGPKGCEDCLMLLELCRQSLVDAARKQQLDLPTSLGAFYCACKAVSHMHSQKPPLTHRDLKPENLLSHPTGKWVLCDFGSSTGRSQVYSGDALLLEEENIRKYTTPAYRAPEMWDLHCREVIDVKSDIWALGCILYWLSFGKLAFAGDSKLAVLNGSYAIPEYGGTPAIRELIREMLVVDPKARPDIRGVLAKLVPILQAEGVVVPQAKAPQQEAVPARPPPPPSNVDNGRAHANENWRADFGVAHTQPAMQPAVGSRPHPDHQNAEYSTFGRHQGVPSVSDSREPSPLGDGEAGVDDHGFQQQRDSVPRSGSVLDSTPVTNSLGSMAVSHEPDSPPVQNGAIPSDALPSGEPPGHVPAILATNAALKTRVAQLESIVRSQADTIKALQKRLSDSQSARSVDRQPVPTSTPVPGGESDASPWVAFQEPAHGNFRTAVDPFLS